MVDLVGAIRGAVRGGVCIALDGVSGLAAIAAAISNDPNTDEAFQDANAIRCLYCGDADCGQDDLPDPPFTGGQCDGVCYEVTVTSDLSGNEVIQTRGPIGGVRGVTLPGGGRLEILSRSAVNFTNSTSCFPLTTYEFRDTGLGGAVWAAEANPRIVSVAVKDGLVPDDCGNPPVIYPPPPPNIEYDVDITFDDIFGVEVTVPVTVNYSPSTVNFNGNLTIPFTVDLSPTFSVRGNVNLNTGDVNFNFKGNFNPGRTDEEPTIEPPPENAPEEPAPEDLEEGFGIAGVFVYSERTLPRTAETQIPSNIAPTLLVPRIGSVQFEVLGGDLRGWLPDIDIKSVSTFIPCPVEWGAARVVVRWDEGWGGQFIPLYRDLPVI